VLQPFVVSLQYLAVAGPMIIFLNIVICLVGFLAIPIWALGIPGVENEYAKYWGISFNTLIGYVGFSFVVLVIAILQKYKNKGESEMPGSHALKVLMGVAFAVFILVQTYAFSKM